MRWAFVQAALLLEMTLAVAVRLLLADLSHLWALFLSLAPPLLPLPASGLVHSLSSPLPHPPYSRRSCFFVVSIKVKLKRREHHSHAEPCVYISHLSRLLPIGHSCNSFTSSRQEKEKKPLQIFLRQILNQKRKLPI